jgi:probable addiction module antidote protein
MIKPARDYTDLLSELLSDPSEAATYINAMLEDEDSDPSLLKMALKDVSQAYGIARVAAASGLNRENLYRSLSRAGNPTWSTLSAVLKALGLRLRVEVDIEAQTYALPATTRQSLQSDPSTAGTFVTLQVNEAASRTPVSMTGELNSFEEVIDEKSLAAA